MWEDERWEDDVARPEGEKLILVVSFYTKVRDIEWHFSHLFADSGPYVQVVHHFTVPS